MSLKIVFLHFVYWIKPEEETIFLWLQIIPSLSSSYSGHYNQEILQSLHSKWLIWVPEFIVICWNDAEIDSEM